VGLGLEQYWCVRFPAPPLKVWKGMCRWSGQVANGDGRKRRSSTPTGACNSFQSDCYCASIHAAVTQRNAGRCSRPASGPGGKENDRQRRWSLNPVLAIANVGDGSVAGACIDFPRPLVRVRLRACVWIRRHTAHRAGHTNTYRAGWVTDRLTVRLPIVSVYLALPMVFADANRHRAPLRSTALKNTRGSSLVGELFQANSNPMVSTFKRIEGPAQTCSESYSDPREVLYCTSSARTILLCMSAAPRSAMRVHAWSPGPWVQPYRLLLTLARPVRSRNCVWWGYPARKTVGRFGAGSRRHGGCVRWDHGVRASHLMRQPTAVLYCHGRKDRSMALGETKVIGYQPCREPKQEEMFPFGCCIAFASLWDALAPSCVQYQSVIITRPV